MAKESKQSGGGVGICTILFVVFLTLKLTNVIDWSWWWVTAPIWIPLGIVALILIVVGIGYLVMKSK
jgi:hypothetical protein